jgi:hypothetical protein
MSCHHHYSHDLITIIIIRITTTIITNTLTITINTLTVAPTCSWSRDLRAAHRSDGYDSIISVFSDNFLFVILFLLQGILTKKFIFSSIR